jgi:hypothetical protein
MRRLGAESAQTRTDFVDTLAAGGGWTESPPGWGRAGVQATVGAAEADLQEVRGR